MTPTALIPLVGPVALLVVAILSRDDATSRPRYVKRALALASGVGLLGALTAVAHVAIAGPTTSPVTGLGQLASVRLDGLSVAIFTMVALLFVVIARFSATYLEGDPRHSLFLGRLAATAAAVEVLVIANNLALIWLAWVATSLCLHGLLVFYRERPRAQIAARKKFVVMRVGDVALGLAFVLLARHFGTQELTALLAALPDAEPSAAVTAAGLLLAVTAMLKSAQFPTHGWLVEVMETPTPVSALLHAGILNAGPFLILRFAPVLDQAVAASWLLVVVGGVTALFGSVVLRTQPSVKVALGYSSAAHMGFSLFVCGLGVYPAAALHFIAHSFYKAHAFLSAGSAVESSHAARVELPARAGRPLRVAAGALVGGSVFVAIGALFGFTPAAHPGLLLVGAVVVLGLTQLLGAGFDRPSPARVLLATVGLSALVATAFFGFEELSRLALAGAVPAVEAPEPVTMALAVGVASLWVVALALQVLGRGRSSRWARRLRVHLRHGLYANAIFDRLVGAMRLPSTPNQGTTLR